jgi:hypothetical protein
MAPAVEIGNKTDNLALVVASDEDARAVTEKAELLKLIRCGLEHAGLDPSPELVLIFADMINPVRAQVAVEKWRRAETTPAQIRALDFWWFYTIHRTALSLMNAVASEKRREASRFKDNFYQIAMKDDCCRRSRHAALDGFTALQTDPVWRLLRGPFDWDCMCMIVSVPYADLPLDVDPLKPGMERLPQELLQDCISWIPRNPKHLLDRSPLSPRPIVETRRCYPGKTPDECKAVLKKYGISIKVE